MRNFNFFPRTRNYIWQGPVDLPRYLKLEWRFVAIRWLGIALVAASLPFAKLPGDRLVAAYVVLAVAALYNLFIQRMVQQRPDLFANGYLTTLGDSLLNIAIVNVGGGFDSPFYFILFTVTISAAMRYGYGPSLAMAGLFATFDAAQAFTAGHNIDAPFIFRSGFLGLTSILAVYLREEAQRAEAALQERLRQANLLNESTAMVAASLEFEPALHAVVAAVKHFFGGHSAVLRSSVELDEDASATPTLVHSAAESDDQRRLHRELEPLCSRPRADQWASDRGSLIEKHVLPSGEQAIVLVLALPNRQISPTTLALAMPKGRPVPVHDPDVLESFIERMTLAIENASLYRALAKRTSDVQRAYADLASAHQELLSVDEMKTNFLANVSHELRTPLTSIRGFSELLLTYDNSEEVQREFLEVINSESERLSRLVNDVLDITKIESGQIDWHMETFDVSALLQESARVYAALIENQNLTFHQDIAADLPPLYGDRDRMQQVIGNLLNNAMKFTPSGSISLSARRNGDEVEISVSDTGVGIAVEDQERIFEKFQQVGAMLTDKPEGTGLGLSICREIVEHHNGQISVESEPGKGSTFTVWLSPAAGAAEPVVAAEPVDEAETAVRAQTGAPELVAP
jgi:signal transduction histidine kinase